MSLTKLHHNNKVTLLINVAVRLLSKMFSAGCLFVVIISQLLNSDKPQEEFNSEKIVRERQSTTIYLDFSTNLLSNENDFFTLLDVLLSSCLYTISLPRRKQSSSDLSRALLHSQCKQLQVCNTALSILRRVLVLPIKHCRSIFFRRVTQTIANQLVV